MLKKRLREEYGVALSGEVYEVPLHLQPVFQPWADGPLPGAEEICARHVCLPISAVMTTERSAGLGALQASSVTARRPAAVTGGSGFIGSSVVDALVAPATGCASSTRGRPAATTSSGSGSTSWTWMPSPGRSTAAAPVFHLAAMADVNEVIASRRPPRSTSSAP